MKYPNMTWSRMQAVVDKLGGEEGVERFLRGELICTSVSLLREVASISVPAVKLFVARDHFKVNIAKNALVCIRWLGDDFNRYFLGKGEEDIHATTMALHKLLRDSADRHILTELRDRAETSLAHLWHLLSQQGQGQSGPLLTDGRYNISYIRDAKKRLWVVSAVWDTEAWYVDAQSVDRSVGWDLGRRVVSRK